MAKKNRLASLLREYRRSKLGVVGIAIILFFVVLAVTAPLLTDKNPITDQNLASDYSVPIWAKSFPQYSNFPVNSMLLSGSDLSSSLDLQQWQISSPQSLENTSRGLTYYPSANGLVTTFTSVNSSSQELDLSQTFHYPWTYPCGMIAGITLTPLNQTLATNDLSVDIYIKDASSKVFHILSPAVYADPGDSLEYFSNFPKGQPSRLIADANNPFVNLQATGSSIVVTMGQCGLSQGIFGRPGDLTITYIITSKVTTSVLLSQLSLYIPGRAYGLLGTDEIGRDIWSQFVYGARTSLIVGLAAAIMSVVIGTVVGLVSGFEGGIVDEVLMRVNDFFLVIPFLPFILVLLIIMQLGHVAVWINTELLIIILLGVLSWNAIARIIRSQVITVKQKQFVEASKALGASHFHVIRKHILPNVMGLVYANVALTVPGAILTEAALSFLGFGDPSVVSWGTVVSASAFAMTSNLGFAWWWFLPPGLAIALLSTSFVLVGFSLDSILNPKLRRR